MDQIEGLYFVIFIILISYYIISGFGEMDQGKRICCEANSLFCYIYSTVNNSDILYMVVQGQQLMFILDIFLLYFIIDSDLKFQLLRA